MPSCSVRVFTSLFLLFTLSPLARGAFRLEPIPAEYPHAVAEELGLRYGEYLDDAKPGKLPEGVRSARLGQIALDCVTPIRFAACAPEEGKPFDAVIFDLNGDGDFTNDPKFGGFTPPNPDNPESLEEGARVGQIELPLPQGPPCKMTLVLAPNSVHATISLWLRGKVNLGGREWDAVVSCLLGTFGTPENEVHLLLDTNGNGRFDVESFNDLGNRGPEEFHFESEVTLLGVLYEARFDKTRMELVLNPSAGPQGKLACKPEFAAKIKSWGLNGYYGAPGAQDPANPFSITEQHNPILLKARDLQIQFAQMCLVTESGQRHLVMFAMKEPLKILDGQTTTLPLGRVKRFDVALTQKQNQLVVERIFEGGNGVQYSLIMPLLARSAKPSEWAKMPAPDFGHVVIRDVQGQILNEGALAATGGECGYTWNLSSSLKKGNRLKVSVTWETDLFGKLEAEKEMVLDDITTAK